MRSEINSAITLLAHAGEPELARAVQRLANALSPFAALATATLQYDYCTRFDIAHTDIRAARNALEDPEVALATHLCVICKTNEVWKADHACSRCGITTGQIYPKAPGQLHNEEDECLFSREQAEITDDELDVDEDYEDCGRHD